MTPIEWRFWPKVKIQEGCWEWTGAKLVSGYGHIRVGEACLGMAVSHRVSYELMVGPIPTGMQVDHICNNPSCVNPSHLRACTPSQNVWNSRKQRNNTSGFKGVRRHKKRWVAAISAHGECHYLGLFKTPELAHEAYVKAALNIHGEFANFGEML